MNKTIRINKNYIKLYNKYYIYYSMCYEKLIYKIYI